MQDFEDHSVVANAEAVALRSRERFSKLQRVWLTFVEAHLGRDTLF